MRGGPTLAGDRQGASTSPFHRHAELSLNPLWTRTS